MTWLENYMYCLSERRRLEQIFLDMLIGHLTADMYQIFKGKKYKLSTFDPFRAGVCRPCVETELTATKKSATDGN